MSVVFKSVVSIILPTFLFGIIITGSEGIVQTTDCYQSKCYQPINTPYEKLLEEMEKFGKAVEEAKFNNTELQELDEDIQKMRNETASDYQSLNGTVFKLDESKTNYTVSMQKLEDFLEKIQDLKKLNEVVKEIRDEKKLLSEGVEASNVCSELQTLINETLNDVEEFKKANVSTTILNKQIHQTNEKVGRNKHVLDNLEIPEQLFGNYVYDLEERLNTTIADLERNTKIFERLLKKFNKNHEKTIKNQIIELKELLTNLATDLNTTNVKLDNFNESISVQVKLLENFETKVKKIEAKMDILENKLNELEKFQFPDLDPIIVKLNNKINETQKERKRIEEYLKFFDILPIEQNKITEIDLELQKITDVIDLLKQKELLQEELRKFEIIDDELNKHKMCPPIVTFEE